MARPAPQIVWMPDLCRLPRLGAMLGLAELVVLVVTLVPDAAAARSITLARFVSASGLALWLALAVKKKIKNRDNKIKIILNNLTKAV